MGLLDQVVGAALGGAGTAGTQRGNMNAVLLQQLVALLSKPGALSSLAAASQQQGLGGIVQSWISTGQNMPVSASQLQQILGSGVVADMAEKAGVGIPEASSALSNLLPQVVDKVTPNGDAPSGDALSSLLGSVGKLIN